MHRFGATHISYNAKANGHHACSKAFRLKMLMGSYVWFVTHRCGAVAREERRIEALRCLSHSESGGGKGVTTLTHSPARPSQYSLRPVSGSCVAPARDEIDTLIRNDDAIRERRFRSDVYMMAIISGQRRRVSIPFGV